MPRKYRLTKKRRIGLTDCHRLQLACGQDFLGEAWGNLAELSAEQRPATLADMRAGWRAHRETVCDEFYRKHPRWSKCWAWWQFDSPQPRDHERPEYLQLFQMGALSKTIARQQAQRELKSYLRNDWQPPFQPFRRPAGKWLFLSPEPRTKESELRQLERMDLLTTREQQILAGDCQAMRGNSSQDRSTWLQHLTAQERQRVDP